MSETEFQREVLDRLIRIETTLISLPELQKKVNEHGEAIAAHEREFNSISRTATIVSLVVSSLVNLLAFFLGVKAK